MNIDIEKIVHTYSDMLLKLAVHYTQNTSDAHDIVQNVYIKLLTHPTTFQSDEHEKAWLIRVCINLCKDYHKTSWNKKVILDDESLLLIKSEDNFEEKDVSILKHVLSLPANQKSAIYLFYYQEMSVNEIANIMQANKSTVLSWLKRGRDKLEKLIKEDI